MCMRPSRNILPLPSGERESMQRHATTLPLWQNEPTAVAMFHRSRVSAPKTTENVPECSRMCRNVPCGRRCKTNPFWVECGATFGGAMGCIDRHVQSAGRAWGSPRVADASCWGKERTGGRRLRRTAKRAGECSTQGRVLVGRRGARYDPPPPFWSRACWSGDDLVGTAAHASEPCVIAGNARKT